MKVIVFSYNREEMLCKLVNSLMLNEIDFHVIDDGSDFDIRERIHEDRLTVFNNGGKEKFWIKFAEAFHICRMSEHNDFLFIPDDFQDVDFESLELIAESWEDKLYSLNVINDGREFCWGKYKKGIEPIKSATIDNTLVEVGFNDCGFLTNRNSLNGINIRPVPLSWFDRPDKSSGVGHMLTVQMREMGIPMMKPIKSLAFHGEHESVMHGKHRNEIKLKSK